MLPQQIYWCFRVTFNHFDNQHINKALLSLQSTCPRRVLCVWRVHWVSRWWGYRIWARIFKQLIHTEPQDFEMEENSCDRQECTIGSWQDLPCPLQGLPDHFWRVWRCSRGPDQSSNQTNIHSWPWFQLAMAKRLEFKLVQIQLAHSRMGMGPNIRWLSWAKSWSHSLHSGRQSDCLWRQNSQHQSKWNLQSEPQLHDLEMSMQRIPAIPGTIDRNRIVHR